MRTIFVILGSIESTSSYPSVVGIAQIIAVLRYLYGIGRKQRIIHENDQHN